MVQGRKRPILELDWKGWPQKRGEKKKKKKEAKGRPLQKVTAQEVGILEKCPSAAQKDSGRKMG